MGFFKLAKEFEIQTSITKVGDRYVLEEMVKNGLLEKTAGPFGDVVYRPTDAGRSYINALPI